MSRYVDIAALTRSVLASVEESIIEKVAVATTAECKTEIGRAIKQAAEKLQSFDDCSVKQRDLNELIKQANLMGAAGGAALGSVLGPAGTLAGAGIGHLMTRAPAQMSNPGAAAPGMPNAGPAATPAPMAAAPGKVASELSNALRQVAADIQKQGAANQEIRLTKAAQMLTAAVGLAHLTENLK